MTAPGQEFFVDYDDFSGGMFVGNNDAKMPSNTFAGDNMLTCEVDGMLMPAAAWVPRSDVNVALLPPGVARGVMQAYLDATAGSYVYAINDAETAMIREAVDADPTHHAWDTQFGGISRGSNAVAASTASGFARMGAYIVWFAPATPRVYLLNYGSGVVSNVAVPSPLFYPVTFGQFVVGAYANLLFWCDASDPTSWTATSFVAVGGTGYSITSLVVLGQSLMVGKPDGWWQVTGVLGENETVVQVATEGPSGAASVGADNSLTFPGRLFDGSAVRVLRGSVVSTLAFQESTVSTYNNMYSAGGFLLGTGAGAAADEIIGRSPTGRWFHLDGAHQNGTHITAFTNGPATHPFAYAYLGASNATGFPYRMLLAPVNPPMTAPGTAFNTATATLADYKRTSRFRVKSVIAELDLGVTTINATRSIGVRVQTPGQVLEGATPATAFSAAGSTLQTIVLPAVASTNGERVTVRFNPADGQDTYTMIPQITLQGVKLRRLLVRCASVGGD